MLSAVGVIIGLASRAPLTFFDEPYLGLDAVARQLFYDRLLADYAEHPRTVVLSTHLIDEVSRPHRARRADRPRPDPDRRGRRRAPRPRGDRHRPGRGRRARSRPATRSCTARSWGASCGSRCPERCPSRRSGRRGWSSSRSRCSSSSCAPPSRTTDPTPAWPPSAPRTGRSRDDHRDRCRHGGSHAQPRPDGGPAEHGRDRAAARHPLAGRRVRVPDQPVDLRPDPGEHRPTPPRA